MKTAELQKETAGLFRKYRKDQLVMDEWHKFIYERRAEHGELFNDILREILDNYDKVRNKLKSYLESPAYLFRIRKYCNLHLHTDIEPNEVIEVISPKKVKIRRMQSVQKVAPKEFHEGGFLGNFADNQSQQWECVSDPEGETEIIRLTKRGWGGGRYRMNDEPKKFYDYNF